MSEPLPLPNDGRTDRKVKATLLGTLGGGGFALLTDLPDLAGDAVKEGMEGSFGPAAVRLAVKATVVGATVGLQLLGGWAAGFYTPKGPRDG